VISKFLLQCNTNLPVLLGEVDFSDPTSTTEEINMMGKIYKALMETKPLGITVLKARELRKLKRDIPSFCQ